MSKKPAVKKGKTTSTASQQNARVTARDPDAGDPSNTAVGQSPDNTMQEEDTERSEDGKKKGKYGILVGNTIIASKKYQKGDVVELTADEVANFRNRGVSLEGPLSSEEVAARKKDK